MARGRLTIEQLKFYAEIYIETKSNVEIRRNFLQSFHLGRLRNPSGRQTPNGTKILPPGTCTPVGLVSRLSLAQLKKFDFRAGNCSTRLEINISISILEILLWKCIEAGGGLTEN